MARPLGQTATADSIAAEYLTWESSGARFLVHMHRDAIDGLARDVIEHSQGLPVEVGGLLLGHAARSERPVVWIERYRRVECRHSSGPHFILDPEDHDALEQAAVELSETNGELSVVGIYRSHLRPGFHLEGPDFELTDRYFKDPEDLFLLIRPVEKADGPTELVAQFFLHELGDGDPPGEIRPAEPAFPFNSRRTAKAERGAEEAKAPEAPKESEAPKEPTGRSTPVANPPAAKPEPPHKENFRRLVPDFGPATSDSPRPSREFFMESHPGPTLLSSTEDLSPPQGFLHRRWPMVAALLLVGGGVAVFVQQAAHRDSSATPIAESREVRPLGLYVDPSGSSWRVSWSSSATALQGTRGVKLFVRDGDEDPKVVDFKPGEQGYEYQPKGRDVTFRLEVTDAGGRVWAETYRLVKAAEEKSAAAPAPQAPAVARPKPLNRVAPVVPASIRPRIKGIIPVDVRVQVDEHGKVVSATPLIRAHSGLESYLSQRAVEAARQWRYAPDAPGTEIIHFTFKK